MKALLTAVVITGACAKHAPAIADGSELADASLATADATPAGVIVPLEISYPPSQVVIAASVTVGATTFETMVDTGSSGLRILPGVLAPSDIVSTSTTQVMETYANGVRFIGVAAMANVTLGTVTTPAPIPVMLIQTVQCVSDRPHCPAAGYTAATYVMKPDAQGHGFKATMGVGMHNAATAAQIGDPIVQMPGHPSALFRIPGGYGATAGTIELGPTANELDGLVTIQLPTVASDAPLADGSPAWDDWTVPICIVDNTGGAKYCKPGLLDSGAAPTIIYEAPTGPPSLPYQLASGDSITVSVNAASPGAYSFTVGATVHPGLDEVDVTTATTIAAAEINLGTAIFFRDDVLFDHEHGVIGLTGDALH